MAAVAFILLIAIFGGVVLLTIGLGVGLAKLTLWIEQRWRGNYD